MNASLAESDWTVLYRSCRAEVDRVCSASCVALTTVGLLEAVKNDRAPDLGSTPNVASSSGSGMSIVQYVSVMSYLRLCWFTFAVFGSSVWIFRLMPSGLSSDCRIVAMVRSSEKPEDTRIVVEKPFGTLDLAISCFAAFRSNCSPWVAG